MVHWVKKFAIISGDVAMQSFIILDLNVSNTNCFRLLNFSNIASIFRDISVWRPTEVQLLRDDLSIKKMVQDQVVVIRR